MPETKKRTDINFEEFRKRLLAERDRLENTIRREHSGAVEEISDVTDNELAAQYTFDPADNEDAAAATYDVERYQSFEINERQMLDQVNAALARIDDGTYGLDEVTGEPIPVKRLRALPWATMTFENANERDL
ncbi:MAG TPA: hypothetical protein VKT32_04580 [Chthonomonadaceae bacterium]|nr:hypothetical protein [Chthonomonadaceae bacterium]